MRLECSQMSYDVQITYPQQIINVTSVAFVPGQTIPTLQVIGDDFRSVDSVLVNEVPSPNVAVLSKTKLWTTVPPEVQGNSLLTISVVSYQFVYTDQSVVAFRAGRTNRKVSGIQQLVQLFVKVLFTTPGSDIFNQSLGGGGLTIVGSSFAKDTAGSLVSDFVIAVDNTVRQIVFLQSQQFRLPPDERLLSAKVESAKFYQQQTALVVSVALTSQAGTEALASIIA